jgi:hypothetical protein
LQSTPQPSPEQKAKIASKRFWLLTAVTYILVVVFTIMAIVVYRHMDAQIRSERHADLDQHN